MACTVTFDSKNTGNSSATFDVWSGASFFTYVPNDQRAQLATLSPYFPNWWSDEEPGSALVPA